MNNNGSKLIHDLALNKVKPVLNGRTVEFTYKSKGFFGLKQMPGSDSGNFLMHILPKNILEETIKKTIKELNKRQTNRIIILQHNKRSFCYLIERTADILGLIKIDKGKYMSYSEIKKLMENIRLKEISIKGSGFLSPLLLNMVPEYLQSPLFKLTRFLDNKLDDSCLKYFARNLIVVYGGNK